MVRMRVGISVWFLTFGVRKPLQHGNNNNEVNEDDMKTGAVTNGGPVGLPLGNCHWATIGQGKPRAPGGGGHGWGHLPPGTRGWPKGTAMCVQRPGGGRTALFCTTDCVMVQNWYFDTCCGNPSTRSEPKITVRLLGSIVNTLLCLPPPFQTLIAPCMLLEPVSCTPASPETCCGRAIP